MKIEILKTDSQHYRYGFQGQEMDDEIKGEGNSVNYKYRMHDPRVGRFFAVDPLTSEYAYYSPYSFSGNKVIAWKELEGLEEYYSADGKTFLGKVGKSRDVRRITSKEHEKHVLYAVYKQKMGLTKSLKKQYQFDDEQAYINSRPSFHPPLLTDTKVPSDRTGDLNEDLPIDFAPIPSLAPEFDKGHKGDNNAPEEYLTYGDDEGEYFDDEYVDPGDPEPYVEDKPLIPKVKTVHTVIDEVNNYPVNQLNQKTVKNVFQTTTSENRRDIDLIIDRTKIDFYRGDTIHNSGRSTDTIYNQKQHKK